MDVTWAELFENDSKRRVAATQRGDVLVSTVFLMLAEDWKPFLWETMILGGEQSGYQERSRTLEVAILHHRQAVRLAFPEDPPETIWGTLPGLNPDGTVGARTVQEVVGRSRWERLFDEEDLV